MPKDDSLLDYREPEWVAEKLGLDKNTVYKYLQEGWLPGVQLGRKWLISERLLAENLESESRNQTAIRRKALPQTPRLKMIIQMAAEYALKRGQDFTGTEHLLIAMISEGENVGAAVLKNLEIDPAKPREIFEARVPAQTKKSREAPLTDPARTAFRLAQEQAIAMGHQYVGNETLLLGLILESTGLGGEILRSLGVTYERARAEVLKLLCGED